MGIASFSRNSLAARRIYEWIGHLEIVIYKQHQRDDMCRFFGSQWL